MLTRSRLHRGKASGCFEDRLHSLYEMPRNTEKQLPPFLPWKNNCPKLNTFLNAPTRHIAITASTSTHEHWIWPFVALPRTSKEVGPIISQRGVVRRELGDEAFIAGPRRCIDTMRYSIAQRTIESDVDYLSAGDDGILIQTAFFSEGGFWEEVKGGGRTILKKSASELMINAASVPAGQRELLVIGQADAVSLPIQKVKLFALTEETSTGESGLMATILKAVNVEFA